MTTQQIKLSQNTARLAGLLYLLLIPIGFFGFVYVPSLLEVPGDIAATMSNIVASESLFRLSMVSIFVMNIDSIVLVLVLYKLLKPTGKNNAALMVVFLLIGAGISMLIELNHFAVLMLSSADVTAVFTAQQSQYLVRLFFDLHKFGSHIAVIFWGLWLFPLGYLTFKSNFLPKFLGVLLILAGVGYVIDSFTLFLVPQYGIVVSDYTFIGELLLSLWLLIKGIDVKQWQKQSLKLAQ
jgi:hypothetical protein